MVYGDCRPNDGDSEESRLAEPLLWIGIYSALANLVCTAAIAADVAGSLARRKPWIPSKLFVLNSASITVLAVAADITNDVNTKMPGSHDQLSKSSGIIFVCVAMCHVMPSLGVMDGGSLVSNMVALGILVVSTFVSISFQIHTGLITLVYNIFTGNAVYIAVMLFIYAILVSHSLSVATVKALLEEQFADGHARILRELDNHAVTLETLDQCMRRYWLMALTSSPDYVLRSSGMYSAVSSLHWVMSTMFLITNFSYLRILGKDCPANSDYRWSVTIILFVQIAAAIMGLAAAMSRLFFSKVDESFRRLLHVERYRLQKIEEWRAKPLTIGLRSGATTVIVAHCAKEVGLLLLTLFQRLVAFLTRFWVLLVHYVSLVVFFPYALLRCFLQARASSSRVSHGGGSADKAEEELGGFILVLEGGVSSRVDRKATARRWKDYPDRWVRSGEARRPRHLLGLLKARKHAVDGGRTPPSAAVWSLQLATLGCIVQAAVVSTDVPRDVWRELTSVIDECFPYAVMVDVNCSGEAWKEVEAAKMVRERRVVAGKWMDVCLSTRGAAADVRRRSVELHKEYEGSNREQWPAGAFAAESMRMRMESLGSGLSVEEVEAEVVAVVTGCLGGLPGAILREFSKGGYGSREEHVRSAATVLGETKEILEMIMHEEKDV